MAWVGIELPAFGRTAFRWMRVGSGLHTLVVVCGDEGLKCASVRDRVTRVGSVLPTLGRLPLDDEGRSL